MNVGCAGSIRLHIVLSWLVLVPVSAYGQDAPPNGSANSPTIASTNPAAGAEDLLYRASLAVAEKSLRLNETATARHWLEQAPVEFRHWEWSYLRSLCDTSMRTIELESSRTTSLAASPDGRWLASADAEGRVVIRELPGLTSARTMKHDDAVYHLCFSADGERLATVSRDMTSRVWDVASGREVARLALENPGVAAVCFAPDGQRLATCSWVRVGTGEMASVRGAVWIWSATTGDAARYLLGDKPLDSMAWSSDGQNIVVGSWDGLVHVLNGDGQEQRTIQLPDESIYNAVVSVDVSRDGRLIAAGSKDRTARVWRITDGELVATMVGHAGYVNEVKFTSDGSRLITTSVDGTVQVWDTLSGRSLRVLRGHTRPVDALCLATDGHTYFSAAQDGTMRFWDARRAADATRFRIQPQGTYTATFSPDGKLLFTAHFNGHVIVSDADSGEKVADWEAHAGSTCNTLSLSGDGRRLGTCSWDRTLRLWDVNERSLLRTITAADGIRYCALSSDGRYAALCVANTVEYWDLDEAKHLWTATEHTAGVQQVVFDPVRPQTFISVSGDQTVRVWDADSRSCIATWKVPDEHLQCLAVSPDGRWVAVGSTRGSVALFERSTGRLAWQLALGGTPIQTLGFSPDGLRLAAGADRVHVLDPLRGRLALTFQPQDDTIYYLAFSPDGRRLATCTTGGSIVICETIPASMRMLPSQDHP